MESDAEFSKKKRLRRRILWKSAAEEYLVKLWANRYNELHATRHTKPLYQQMSDEMKKSGFNYTVIDIKVKIHNLTTKYNKVKTSPKERAEWELYEEIHNILRRSRHCHTEDIHDDSRVFMEDSLVESMDYLPEAHFIEPTEKKPVNIFTKQNDFNALDHEDFSSKKQRRYLTAEEDSDSTEVSGLNAKRRKDYDDSGGEYHLKKTNEAETIENRCLNKLADTVNDVVGFIMKNEIEKSRNEAFYKVLESYMAQLPDTIQDALKIEMLNTVFNKITDINASTDA